MDGGNWLIARNVELETELKLVKEQLCQADNAIVYLLKRVGGETHGSLEYVRKENVLLKKLLRLDQKTDRRIATRFDGLTAYRRLLRNNSKRESVSSPTKSATTSDESLHGDLLSFDDQLIDAPKIDELTPDVCYQNPSSIRNQAVLQRRVGSTSGPDMIFAKSNEGGSIAFNHDVSPDHSYRDTRQVQSLGSRSISLHDSQLVLRLPHSDNLNATSYLGHAGFLDREHNRLMGAACFIESMTAEEQQQHWTQLATHTPRHSANEWQDYYVKVIRPVYLSKGHRIRSKDQEETVVQVEPVNVKDDRQELAEEVCERADQDIEIEAHDISGIGDPQEKSVQSNTTLAVHGPQDEINIQSLPKSDEILYERPPAAKDGPSSSGVDVDSLPIDMAGPISSSLYTIQSPLTLSAIATGLFYNPDRPNEHTRSVLLHNIESSCKLDSVLHDLEVSRRDLLSAKLISTVNMKTRPAILTNTILLLFLTRESAVNFVESTNNAVASSFKFCETKVLEQSIKAVLIGTPSRPVPYALMQLLPGASPGEPTKLSNVLYFKDPVEQGYETFTPDIVTKGLLSHEVGLELPLNVYRDEDGTMKIKCANILDARRAYDELYWHFVRGTDRKIGFVAAADSDHQEKTKIEKLSIGKPTESDESISEAASGFWQGELHDAISENSVGSIGNESKGLI